MTRTITIHPVTRIEGHAKITLDVDDQQQVVGAHLQVLEMRGFEKLLQGMELFKVPLLASRICGVCPAAQLLAAVTAIENGLGVTLPADAKALLGDGEGARRAQDGGHAPPGQRSGGRSGLQGAGPGAPRPARLRL